MNLRYFYSSVTVKVTAFTLILTLTITNSISYSDAPSISEFVSKELSFLPARFLVNHFGKEGIKSELRKKGLVLPKNIALSDRRYALNQKRAELREKDSADLIRQLHALVIDRKESDVLNFFLFVENDPNMGEVLYREDQIKKLLNEIGYFTKSEFDHLIDGSWIKEHMKNGQEGGLFGQVVNRLRDQLPEAVHPLHVLTEARLNHTAEGLHTRPSVILNLFLSNLEQFGVMVILYDADYGRSLSSKPSSGRIIGSSNGAKLAIYLEEYWPGYRIELHQMKEAAQVIKEYLEDPVVGQLVESSSVLDLQGRLNNPHISSYLHRIQKIFGLRSELRGLTGINPNRGEFHRKFSNGVISGIHFLQLLRSKYALRNILRGGPIQQPNEFYLLSTDGGISGTGLPEFLIDPNDVKSFQKISEEITTGKLALPLIFKPNWQGFANGIISFEKREGEIWLTLALAPGLNSPLDRIKHFLMNKKVEAEILDDPTHNISQVKFHTKDEKKLAKILENIFWLTFHFFVDDAGMIEPVLSLTKVEGRAYETRHFFKGNLIDETMTFVSPISVRARVGSSSYFSNQTGRNPDLAYEPPPNEIYQPLLKIYSIPRERWREFENWVDEQIKNEFVYLAKRFKSLGINFITYMQGTFDLGWLPPDASSNGFPVPVLIESGFNVKQGELVSLARHSFVMTGDKIALVEETSRAELRNAGSRVQSLDFARDGKPVELYPLPLTTEARSELRNMRAEAKRIFDLILRASRDYATYKSYTSEKKYDGKEDKNRSLDDYLEARDRLDAGFLELQKSKDIPTLQVILSTLESTIAILRERKTQFIKSFIVEHKAAPDDVVEQMFQAPYFFQRLEEFRDHIKSIQEYPNVTWALPKVEIIDLQVSIPRAWALQHVAQFPSFIVSMTAVKILRKLLPVVVIKFIRKASASYEKYDETISIFGRKVNCHLTKTENERIVNFEVTGLVSSAHRVAIGRAILSRAELRSIKTHEFISILSKLKKNQRWIWLAAITGFTVLFLTIMFWKRPKEAQLVVENHPRETETRAPPNVETLSETRKKIKEMTPPEVRETANHLLSEINSASSKSVVKTPAERVFIQNITPQSKDNVTFFPFGPSDFEHSVLEDLIDLILLKAEWVNRKKDELTEEHVKEGNQVLAGILRSPEPEVVKQALRLVPHTLLDEELEKVLRQAIQTNQDENGDFIDYELALALFDLMDPEALYAAMPDYILNIWDGNEISFELFNAFSHFLTITTRTILTDSSYSEADIDLLLDILHRPMNEETRLQMIKIVVLYPSLTQILINHSGDDILNDQLKSALQERQQELEKGDLNENNNSRSEFRNSTEDALGTFGIMIESPRTIPPIDFSNVPDNAEWLMREIRPIELKPIMTTQEIPTIPLSFPLDHAPLLGKSHAKVFLNIGTVNGKEIPVAVKIAGKYEIDKKELFFAQIYDRLGVGPRFYGVVRNSDKKIIGYAMQVVPGSRIPTYFFYGDQAKKDALEILDRLNNIGLDALGDSMLTRKSNVPRVVATDAGEGKFLSGLDAKKRFRQFLRSLNSSSRAELGMKPTEKLASRLELTEGGPIKTILLVEDDPMVIDIYETVLGMKLIKKPEVIPAMNGKEALNVIKSWTKSGKKIDLIVTDLDMPKISGKELVNQLRSSGERVPVIVVTGKGFDRGLEQTENLVQIHKLDAIERLPEIINHLLNRTEKSRSAGGESSDTILSYMRFFMLMARNQIWNWDVPGERHLAFNRGLNYVTNKRIEVDSSEILGTFGCYTCAGMVHHSDRYIHLFHHSTVGETDVPFLISQTAERITQTFQGLDGENSTLVMVTDHLRQEIYKSAAQSLIQKYPNLKLLIVMAGTGTVKSVLAMKEGIAINTGELMPGLAEHVPTDESSKTLAITWKELDLLTQKNQLTEITFDDLLIQTQRSSRSELRSKPFQLVTPMQIHPWNLGTFGLAGADITFSFLGRYGQQMDDFKTFILPMLVQKHRKDRKLKIAVLGSATGEEMATILAAIYQAFERHSTWGPVDEWQIEINGIEQNKTVAAEALKRIRGESEFVYDGRFVHEKKYKEMYPSYGYRVHAIMRALNRYVEKVRKSLRVRVGSFESPKMLRSLKGYDVILMNGVSISKKEDRARVAAQIQKYNSEAFFLTTSQGRDFLNLLRKTHRVNMVSSTPQHFRVTPPYGIAVPEWAKPIWKTTGREFSARSELRSDPPIKTPIWLKLEMEKNEIERTLEAIKIEISKIKNINEFSPESRSLFDQKLLNELPSLIDERDISVKTIRERLNCSHQTLFNRLEANSRLNDLVNRIREILKDYKRIEKEILFEKGRPFLMRRVLKVIKQRIAAGELVSLAYFEESEIASRKELELLFERSPRFAEKFKMLQKESQIRAALRVINSEVASHQMILQAIELLAKETGMFSLEEIAKKAELSLATVIHALKTNSHLREAYRERSGREPFSHRKKSEKSHRRIHENLDRLLKAQKETPDESPTFLTQQEVAKAIGISSASLDIWKRIDRQIVLKVLELIYGPHPLLATKPLAEPETIEASVEESPEKAVPPRKKRNPPTSKRAKSEKSGKSAASPPSNTDLLILETPIPPVIIKSDEKSLLDLVTDEEEMARYYEEFDDTGRHFNNGMIFSFTSQSREIRKLIVNRLKKIIPKEARLLSIGEGRGHLARDLMDERFQVQAIDLSPKNTQFSREIHHVDQMVANAHHLPEDLQNFDAVIINEAIGSLRMKEVLREAHRVLKPGGKIMITTYSPELYLDDPKKSRYIPYTNIEISAALQEAGFEQVKDQPIWGADMEGAHVAPKDMLVLHVLTALKRSELRRKSISAFDKKGERVWSIRLPKDWGNNARYAFQVNLKTNEWILRDVFRRQLPDDYLKKNPNAVIRIHASSNGTVRILDRDAAHGVLRFANQPVYVFHENGIPIKIVLVKETIQGGPNGYLITEKILEENPLSLVYEKAGRKWVLTNSYWRRSRKKFNFEKGTFKVVTQSDKWGNFFVNRKHITHFDAYANHWAEIIMEDGAVTKINILVSSNSKKIIHSEGFSHIYRLDASYGLKHVKHFRALDSKERESLDQVLVRTHLDGHGRLNLGGGPRTGWIPQRNPAWRKKFAWAPADVILQNGLVTDIFIRDPENPQQIIKVVRLNRVHDSKTGQLIGVFYGLIRKERLTHYGRAVTVRGRHEGKYISILGKHVYLGSSELGGRPFYAEFDAKGNLVTARAEKHAESKFVKTVFEFLSKDLASLNELWLLEILPRLLSRANIDGALFADNINEAMALIEKHEKAGKLKNARLISLKKRIAKEHASLTRGSQEPLSEARRSELRNSENDGTSPVINSLRQDFLGHWDEGIEGLRKFKNWFAAFPHDVINWLRQETMNYVQLIEPPPNPNRARFRFVLETIEFLRETESLKSHLKPHEDLISQTLEEIYKILEWPEEGVLKDYFDKKNKTNVNQLFSELLEEEHLINHRLHRKTLFDLYSKEKSESILARIRTAFLNVPRHRFLPRLYSFYEIWEDHPQPIGYKQAISAPSLVVWMLALLDPKPTDKILEIGAGSGWVSGLLSELAEEVHGTELIPELAERAKRNVGKLKKSNVHILLSDGSMGHSKEAPYDAILVSAGSPKVPEDLVNQLKEGGRLVIPVFEQKIKGREQYRLTLYVKENGILVEKAAFELPVLFVPLRGRNGWVNRSELRMQPRNISMEEQIEKKAVKFLFKSEYEQLSEKERSLYDLAAATNPIKIRRAVIRLHRMNYDQEKIRQILANRAQQFNYYVPGLQNPFREHLRTTEIDEFAWFVLFFLISLSFAVYTFLFSGTLFWLIAIPWVGSLIYKYLVDVLDEQSNGLEPLVFRLKLADGWYDRIQNILSFQQKIPVGKIKGDLEGIYRKLWLNPKDRADDFYFFQKKEMWRAVFDEVIHLSLVLLFVFVYLKPLAAFIFPVTFLSYWIFYLMIVTVIAASFLWPHYVTYKKSILDFDYFEAPGIGDIKERIHSPQYSLRQNEMIEQAFKMLPEWVKPSEIPQIRFETKMQRFERTLPFFLLGFFEYVLFAGLPLALFTTLIFSGEEIFVSIWQAAIRIWPVSLFGLIFFLPLEIQILMALPEIMTYFARKLLEVKKSFDQAKQVLKQNFSVIQIDPNQPDDAFWKELTRKLKRYFKNRLPPNFEFRRSDHFKLESNRSELRSTDFAAFGSAISEEEAKKVAVRVATVVKDRLVEVSKASDADYLSNWLQEVIRLIESGLWKEAEVQFNSLKIEMIDESARSAFEKEYFRPAKIAFSVYSKTSEILEIFRKYISPDVWKLVDGRDSSWFSWFDFARTVVITMNKKKPNELKHEESISQIIEKLDQGQTNAEKAREQFLDELKHTDAQIHNRRPWPIHDLVTEMMYALVQGNILPQFFWRSYEDLARQVRIRSGYYYRSEEVLEIDHSDVEVNKIQNWIRFLIYQLSEYIHPESEWYFDEPSLQKENAFPDVVYGKSALTYSTLFRPVSVDAKYPRKAYLDFVFLLDDDGLIRLELKDVQTGNKLTDSDFSNFVRTNFGERATVSLIPFVERLKKGTSVQNIRKMITFEESNRSELRSTDFAAFGSAISEEEAKRVVLRVINVVKERLMEVAENPDAAYFTDWAGRVSSFVKSGSWDEAEKVLHAVAYKIQEEERKAAFQKDFLYPAEVVFSICRKISEILKVLKAHIPIDIWESVEKRDASEISWYDFARTVLVTGQLKDPKIDRAHMLNALEHEDSLRHNRTYSVREYFAYILDALFAGGKLPAKLKERWRQKFNLIWNSDFLSDGSRQLFLMYSHLPGIAQIYQSLNEATGDWSHFDTHLWELAVAKYLEDNIQGVQIIGFDFAFQDNKEEQSEIDIVFHVDHRRSVPDSKKQKIRDGFYIVEVKAGDSERSYRLAWNQIRRLHRKLGPLSEKFPIEGAIVAQVTSDAPGQAPGLEFHLTSVNHSSRFKSNWILKVPGSIRTGLPFRFENPVTPTQEQVDRLLDYRTNGWRSLEQAMADVLAGSRSELRSDSTSTQDFSREAVATFAISPNVTLGELGNIFSSAEKVLRSIFINNPIIVPESGLAIYLTEKMGHMRTQIDRLSTRETYVQSDLIRDALANAIDAIADMTEQQGVPYEGRVVLKIYRTNSNTIIEISDNGIGIDPVILKSIRYEKIVTSKASLQGTKNRLGFKGQAFSRYFEIPKATDGIIEVETKFKDEPALKRHIDFSKEEEVRWDDSLESGTRQTNGTAIRWIIPDEHLVRSELRRGNLEEAKKKTARLIAQPSGDQNELSQPISESLMESIQRDLAVATSTILEKFENIKVATEIQRIVRKMIGQHQTNESREMVGIIFSRFLFADYGNKNLLAPILIGIAKAYGGPIVVVETDGIVKEIIDFVNQYLDPEEEIILAENYSNAKAKLLQHPYRKVSSVRIVASQKEEFGEQARQFWLVTKDVVFLNSLQIKQLYSVFGVTEQLVDTLRSELRLAYAA